MNLYCGSKIYVINISCRLRLTTRFLFSAVLIYCPFRYFPHIFGPNENLPLDKDASFHSFERLSGDVSSHCSGVLLQSMQNLAQSLKSWNSLVICEVAHWIVAHNVLLDKLCNIETVLILAFRTNYSFLPTMNILLSRLIE